MPLTSRPMAGAADFPAVLALRQAIAAHDPQTPRVGEDVLRSAYLEPVPDFETLFRLWERDGNLVGLGEFYAPRDQDDEAGPIVYLRPRLRPAAGTGELIAEMVTWGEAEALALFGEGVRVEVTVRDDMADARALLQERGYRRDRVFLRMERPLEEPVTGQALPAGYTVRPLEGEAEVDAWLELFNAAFADHYDFHPWAREGRLHDMRNAWYVPKLDLVAVAPDGTLAAFCLTERRDAGVWYLSVVGTAREHRRRGLAGALIAETVERLRALGGGTLDLAVDATSQTGADRLYPRLGFRPVSRLIDHRRRLTAAD